MNNYFKTARTSKARVLGNNPHSEAEPTKLEPLNPYGEDVKMVRRITKKQKALTSAERDEIVEKYESGMDVQPIADLYCCHRTTVSRILRMREVAIRD